MHKSPYYRIHRGVPFSMFGGTIKTGHMKCLIIFIIALVTLQNRQAQLLKKIKDKAQQTVNNANNKVGADKANLQVYSKCNSVPGTTILYFDNFAKDNIGETPEGWITNETTRILTWQSTLLVSKKGSIIAIAVKANTASIVLNHSTL